MKDNLEGSSDGGVLKMQSRLQQNKMKKVKFSEEQSTKEIPNLKGFEQNIPVEIRNQVLEGPGITRSYREKIGLTKTKRIRQAVFEQRAWQT